MRERPDADALHAGFGDAAYRVANSRRPLASSRIDTPVVGGGVAAFDCGAELVGRHVVEQK